MSLAEYRTSTEVDVSLVDPLAERLLGLLEQFGGRVLIDSGRRGYAEQTVLWLRYLGGGNLAARPGTSKHERGQAADLQIVDGSVAWDDVHAAAPARGLVFPLLSQREPWHVEADPAWIAPPPPPPPPPLSATPEDPAMLHLIVVDDPAFPLTSTPGVHLVFTGTAIAWVRSGDALGVFDRGGVRAVGCTVAEVTAMLQSIPGTGPSPSTAGAAITW